MKKLILVTVFFISTLGLAACGSCVNDDKVKSAVRKQGCSDITLKSKGIVFVSWRGCSNSDDVVYKASAKNPKDKKVDIIICAGWPFKGVTIRTE